MREPQLFSLGNWGCLIFFKYFKAKPEIWSLYFKISYSGEEWANCLFSDARPEIHIFTIGHPLSGKIANAVGTQETITICVCTHEDCHCDIPQSLAVLPASALFLWILHTCLVSNKYLWRHESQLVTSAPSPPVVPLHNWRRPQHIAITTEDSCSLACGEASCLEIRISPFLFLHSIPMLHLACYRICFNHEMYAWWGPFRHTSLDPQSFSFFTCPPRFILFSMNRFM